MVPSRLHKKTRFELSSSDEYKETGLFTGACKPESKDFWYDMNHKKKEYSILNA